MTPAARRIAAFAASLELDDVPGDVVEAAKLHLLDALGCGLAAHALGVGHAGRSAMAEVGGRPEATVIGLDARLPAASAALANAMLCHALDFDDTHGEAVCHVSVVVGPAALAVAEARRASGRQLLGAVVGGNEVVARLGMAASGAFHRQGFHPTAVCGIFGATAAVARLDGLDPTASASALGIAGSMASGLLAYLEDGTPTKPIHPGWAAHGAVTAVRLAAHGAAGPPSVLEARFGLFHAFLGIERIDLAPRLADLGRDWQTPRIAYKPYPACHYMHGVLGAVAEAAGGRRFAPEEVVEVVVTVPETAVPIVLEPREAKVAPRTEYDAKFSLQYSVAAMLVRGEVAVLTYVGDAIADPDVLAVARRVTYSVKPYASSASAFPGGVRLRLRDGGIVEVDHAHQKGAPEHPLSAAEVRAKFRGNAALALPEAAVQALETAVLRLDREPDLGVALAPLRGTKTAAGALATAGRRRSG